ncbi:MAG TPA: FAD-dependent oxidoreductase, partial [Candidatus Acidoferrum sp.]|nr:FAD-dependent oxidoreductase [Candidatus Acidoferrum sp.]
MAETRQRSRAAKKRWGKSPWTIDFHPSSPALPEEVDFAVIGGGFTGLAAAAWLRHLAPDKTVSVFEAEQIGAGASGNTGGMVLSETSAGDLPGLGDVLGGFGQTIAELGVKCDFDLRGAWEIGRRGARPDSPISWSDSGALRVVAEVAGGTVDAGKLISQLAGTADRLGAQIHENTRVNEIAFQDRLCLTVGTKQIRAENALIATNALSLELNGLVGRAEPKFTLAVATEPLTRAQLQEIGLVSGRSFYTVDLPYLWGRMLPSGGIIFGGGLIGVENWRELYEIDIDSGEAAELIARLERRVRGLHPALKSVGFT